MIKCIVLHFGYVETSRAGSLIFTTEGNFTTRFEALQSLALDLYRQYKVEHPSRYKKCCRRSQEKFGQEVSNFCAICGQDLQDLSIDFLEYKDWLIDLLTQDASSWSPDDSIWWVWNSIVEVFRTGVDSTFEIREKAEAFLIEALDPHRVDPEDELPLLEAMKLHTDQNVWWRQGKTLAQYLSMNDFSVDENILEVDPQVQNPVEESYPSL